MIASDLHLAGIGNLPHLELSALLAHPSRHLYEHLCRLLRYGGAQGCVMAALPGAKGWLH